LEPSVGAPSAAKTGAARGRSRTRRRHAHLPPLLPLLPRRHAAAAFVFLPADESRHRTSPTPALRLVATKVRTSTPLPLWTPRPSSREGTCRHTAPPRCHRWRCRPLSQARLNLLQVSPPSSTCARRLPSLVLLAFVRHTVLPAFTILRRRVRVQARVRAGTTLSRQRAPQHVRTLTRKARLDLWSLFLRRASRVCFFRPRRHGLAVVGCFAHAVAGGRAPSSWSPSARLAAGRSFLAHTLVPTAVALPAATHGAGPSSVAVPAASPPLRPTPSLAMLFTLRAHPSARPHTRVHAPPHQKGASAPPAEHRRRADVAVPTPATTSPRRPPPSSLRSFEPSNPRGSLEVIL
jgi:hypothetical protein